MNILQINVDRRRNASDLMFQTARAESIDIIIVNEPNKKLLKGKEWYVDDREDAAIIKLNRDMKIYDWGKSQGFVWVKMEDMYIYGCYISPNTTYETFENFLQDLGRDIDNNGGETIICGDFNAKSPLWGGDSVDRRGTALAEFVFSRGMVVMNTGSKPTFERSHSRSYIDVTFNTERLAGRIKKWEVLEEESLSLHNYIKMTIEGEGPGGIRYSWGPRRVDKIKAREVIRNNEELGNVGLNLHKYTELLKKVSREASISIRRDQRGNELYWWTAEICEATKKTLKIRRELTRSRARSERYPETRLQVEAKYRTAKRELRKLIMASKDKCWGELLTNLQSDIWGEGYRLTMKALRIKNPKLDLTEERRKEIALELNEWYTHAKFPIKWKEAKLTLIHKPGRNAVDVSSYRPICLLNSFAKLYKAAILQKLNEEIDLSGGMHERQYGFRKGRSTIDALEETERAARTARRSGQGWFAMVTIDIKNAFNSAPWNGIREVLRDRGIDVHLQRVIGDYLSDRKIIIGKDSQMRMTAGVPQGSILGPTLWNLRRHTKSGSPTGY